MAQTEPGTDTKQHEFAIAKVYDPQIEEPRVQKTWAENRIYQFDPNHPNKPTYSIDTPPPYPSGDFHVGNALNWCYFDFVARYERMRGYNVHFPQGWDCHGLPTEVRAEQTRKIRKNDVPPAEFIQICRTLTEEYIAKMKRTIIRLGISTDWALEYRTMDPSYYRLTQLSFLRLYNSGHLYRGEHPVNWCPRCETAIAEAEVEHQERKGVLYHMSFDLDNEKLGIASTRPELLPACVAILVNPKDDRYRSIIAKKAKVPIFSQIVPVIANPDVDSSFGTGAVMVCTFGDKMDVKWQKKYGLPLIRVITENGRLSIEDPRFKGARVEEARKRIAEVLSGQGRILKAEPHTQSVGVCWRCKTPVEIISRPQWFMKTMELTQVVVQSATKLKWIPEYARTRLVDWANSLDWDWVISRQRIFATPIPVWYCRKCSHTMVPKESDLPVDPRQGKAPFEKCTKCGSVEFMGETDVLDTWMDSSITAPVHAGWPDESEKFQRLFPASLQPNGLDIVRTWDYYLLVRSLALFGKPPYKTLLINGMVRGTDGRMMHKSYGNYVESGEAMTKYGADPLRQWAAAGGSTGSDIPFRWTEMDHGKKFLTKLWNIARYIITSTPQVPVERTRDQLPLLDRWLLSCLQNLIERVTEHFENRDFNLALEAVRDYAWHALADDYLETVKHRLTQDANDEDRENAQFCLHQSLLAICKLLAPICPHVADAIFQEMPKPSDEPQSVHTSTWPSPNKQWTFEGALPDGKTLIGAIALSRRKKAENGISLKTPIKTLRIGGTLEQLKVLRENQEVILRTIKADTLDLSESSSLVVDISQ